MIKKILNVKSSALFVAVLAMILVIAGSCQSQPQRSGSGYNISTATIDGTGKFYFGREIAQVMGPGGTEWLERDTRQQEENSNLAISKLPLKGSMSVADIGAGSGYYAFRIAEKLPKGKVYAVEIQDEMIGYLSKRKSELKNRNVEIVKGSDHSPNLPDSSIDLAIMVDVYHELFYPREMLQNIRRALRPNGRLVLLEYRGEDPNVPIKELHKMSVAQVNREMTANGFTLAYKGDFLPIQHFLVYRKK
ncbi:MAG TPA: class I SAM-dependent methyltransferase [Chitinophagaceae bacterium]|nr:class I SAM-dependent methyltransferase [Chitinophagaceae bacterium]